jgi:hypothetical protein
VKLHFVLNVAARLTEFSPLSTAPAEAVKTCLGGPAAAHLVAHALP